MPKFTAASFQKLGKRPIMFVMSKIRLLDVATINKIAAGEVIERPSSVVKELIENSLDAHASEIKVALVDGGKKRIQITDNGTGIDQNDLPLVAIKHATSKISKLDDLDHLHTFGFRGEAIASIGYMAKCELTSKTAEDVAFRIQFHQDHISNPEPAQHPQGTTLIVENLFESYPVRQKFLRSATTELGYIFDVVQQFALFNPEVDFILTHNQKELLNTRGMTEQKTRIIMLLGKQFQNKLHALDTQIGPIRFNGFISDASLTFSTRQKQFIAINKRMVKSPLLQKALSQSYSEIFASKAHPLLIINIQVPEDTIDVNIHPQKWDIKFLNPGFLYDTLPKVIRASLYSAPPELKTQTHIQTQTQSYQPAPMPHPTIATQKNNAFQAPAPTISMASRPISDTKPNEKSWPQLLTLHQTPPSKPTPHYLQLHDTYIIYPSDEGLCLIDQHAAHERILFEKLKANYGNTQYRQQLLISETIPLTKSQYIQFQNIHPILDKMGFEIESFGNDQIVVRSCPLELDNTNLTLVLTELLETLSTEEHEGAPQNQVIEAQLIPKIQQIACKAAVKAGKKMTTQEITALLQSLETNEINATCPHGRPIMIQLTQSDIAKLFKRT